MKEDVYINFSKGSTVHNQQIKLQDVCDVWCKNTAVLAGIKNTTIAHLNSDKDNVYVFTAISVIKMIYEKFPDICIQNMGETEFAVFFTKKKKQNFIWQLIKIVFICCIVFCGGAFAIMAYGNDIDIGNVFLTLTKFFAGDEAGNTMLIRMAYSVGLSVGIIIFFVNFGKNKKCKDPTPIQVSMRTYEDDLYTAIINNNMREGSNTDVD